MELHSLATGHEPAPAPAPRTYWVIPGKLLAGAYPGAPTPKDHRARIEALWNAGVRTFVNLMEENETNNAGKPFAPYQDIVNELARASGEDATCLRYPIRDLDVPSFALMGTLLAAIDRSLARGSAVYVHCFGGVGRTGTAVCAWIHQHGLVNADNVFSVLSELRRADKLAGQRPAPETEKQRTFVKEFTKSVDATAMLRSRILGCLLGGALGDAFGAPIEFMSLHAIREKYGPDGLLEFTAYAGRLGAITDDTQMTLFTVEGIVRANARS
ncbi:MAG: ADP-ribosylglycohydrolase family protein, partial [Polyangiaceae bacterium]|nr:ADP-ribosylglycohydrolase family protein [Polyangiaceae bacterium]